MPEHTVVAQLEEVTRGYVRGSERIRALDGVTLQFPAGSFTAVVGPSGSGKSTLLNILGCMDRPSSGRIRIHGDDVTGASEQLLTAIRRRTIGFVFQQFFLIPTLTVLENVQVPGLFAGNPSRHERARALLSSVGLGDRLHHRPGQLSGGEMQRVAIARALVNNPDILLADEPTGNLDSKTAAGVFDLFLQLNRSGLTIVMVTHNMDLARCCTRVVTIRDGRVHEA
jgi:putative ABC transport system ATP-binding protein